MAALEPDLEAQIEAYLLGRLSDEEQTRIEAHLFQDDDVFEAIRDAEDDLIDRYIAGQLARADRDAFEQVFATTKTRQQRIAFARTLSRGLAVAPARDAAPPPATEAVREPARPAAARRRVVLAAAALAAAVAIGIAWWALTSERPSSPSGGSAVATFSLPRTDLRRGAGNLPHLALPEGTSAIRFQLEVDAPGAAAGNVATLRRVGGLVTWQGTADPGLQHDRVSVTIPARFVVPGDYVLSFAAPGTAPEDSAQYPFRVVSPH